MNYSFNGLNEAVTTFSGNVSVGDIVVIGDNCSVSKAVADKDIMGVCVSKNYGVVGVMLRGTAEVKYSGAAPVLGYTGLVTAGNNMVKVSESGIKYLVLNVDTANRIAVILL